ncbi:DoxX family protein [Advenella sp. WQ 585]|uniref:DoxX family protein n=1 Tax=Advenella mandrilli TaxID=2800330 RepID=A0ABS1EA66_9BURK|nr:DoxX family protein [Advenella mandrilli]MBK1779773.1 DoxX family protein [Advenella mandrilli]
MLKSDDLAKLFLRLAIGFLILFHGLTKIMNGIDPVIGMVTAKGLPAFFAYGVYVGEVVAPIMIIIGLYTRPAALVIAVNMLFAFFLAHMGQLSSFTRSGGWAPELPALFLVGALVIFLGGAGKYCLNSPYNN